MDISTHDEFVQFMAQLLDLDPDTRITANEAFFHPFLQKLFPFSKIFANPNLLNTQKAATLKQHQHQQQQQSSSLSSSSSSASGSSTATSTVSLSNIDLSDNNALLKHKNRLCNQHQIGAQCPPKIPSSFRNPLMHQLQQPQQPQQPNTSIQQQHHNNNICKQLPPHHNMPYAQQQQHQHQNQHQHQQQHPQPQHQTQHQHQAQHHHRQCQSNHNHHGHHYNHHQQQQQRHGQFQQQQQCQHHHSHMNNNVNPNIHINPMNNKTITNVPQLRKPTFEDNNNVNNNNLFSKKRGNPFSTSTINNNNNNNNASCAASVHSTISLSKDTNDNKDIKLENVRKRRKINDSQSVCTDFSQPATKKAKR